MKIILTSDVELWSWNRNFEQDIVKGVLSLIKLVEKEKIPITFFISLSDKGYEDKDYLSKIISFIRKIKSKYVSFGTHTHCKNLPLNFNTESDNLKDYPKENIIKILKWYKKELDKSTKKKIYLHRSGNYTIPDLRILDECFLKSGLNIDSSYILKEYSNIIKLKNMIEIPPATNKKYSKKLIVWSPEQMSLKQMIDFYNQAKNKSDLLVINFHSFSVYGDLGKKKKLWYLIPKNIKKIIKPLINLLKKKTKIKSNKRISKNFENLIKIIRFLKRNNADFQNFENV